MVKVVIGIGIVLIIAGAFLFHSSISKHTTMIEPTVSTSSTKTSSVVESPSSSPSTTSTQGVKLSKLSYKVALFGDSLIDTMIDAPENVETLLRKDYPQNLFKVYNYGIGAQSVQDGLDRWALPFSNRGREYPPIADVTPDVIIIGSFAYNPMSPPEKHKELLSQLVAKAKETSARVFMLAEIAPLAEDFGKGPKGVNWPPEQSKEHAQEIIGQLQDVFAVAKEQNVPVIDIYNISKTPGSDFGRRELVSIDDGIHPSPEGHKLTAETIISTIALK